MGAFKNTPYVLLQIFLVAATAWLLSGSPPPTPSACPGVFCCATHGAKEPRAPTSPHTSEEAPCRTSCARGVGTGVVREGSAVCGMQNKLKGRVFLQES